jgi:hypothetical protein
MCCSFCLVIFSSISILLFYFSWLLSSLAFTSASFSYFYILYWSTFLIYYIFLCLALFSSINSRIFLSCYYFVRIYEIPSSGCLLVSCLFRFARSFKCSILLASFSYIYICSGVIFIAASSYGDLRKADKFFGSSGILIWPEMMFVAMA